MKRREDWEQRLNDYLAGQHGQTFEWGKADCALFVAGAVQAMTGKDFARGFRRKYRDEQGAAAVLEAAGARNLSEFVEQRLTRKPKAMAQRGDVAMVKGGHLAIVFGEVTLGIGEDPATGRAGLIRIPRSDWRKAWGIG